MTNNNKKQLLIECCFNYKSMVKWRLLSNAADMWFKMNGPAVITSAGLKAWWINNGLHNEYGPALIGLNGVKQWFMNGKLIKTK